MPGGRVVLNTPGNIQPVFELMEQAIIEHIDPELGGFVGAVFSMHHPDTVTTLLRDTGWRAVSATVSTATLKLPAPAEFLWQYINVTPMGAVVARAPEQAKLAMEQQFVDRCTTFVVDGTTVVHQPMVVASGRR